MTLDDNIHRSRFGFHVCDHATYLKLKRLHRWYWQTVKDFHRWWRWQRKLPHNRRGSEPRYCCLFTEDQPWRRLRRVHGQDAVRVYPKTLVDRGVLEWYRAARTPYTEPPGPLSGQILQVIDRLVAEGENWFGRT